MQTAVGQGRRGEERVVFPVAQERRDCISGNRALRVFPMHAM